MKNQPETETQPMALLGQKGPLIINTINGKPFTGINEASNEKVNILGTTIMIEQTKD